MLIANMLMVVRNPKAPAPVSSVNLVHVELPYFQSYEWFVVVLTEIISQRVA